MNLIQELDRLQREAGHLRVEDLRALAKRSGVPLSEIEAVSSFYPHFRRTAPPRVRVAACRDLSCRLRGGAAEAERLRALCAELPDVEYEEVSCLGRCDSAPACTVNDHPLPTSAVGDTLRDPERLIRTSASEARRWQIDPYSSPGEHYGVLRRALADDDWPGLIARLEGSGLRGMGGAGFPTGRKWGLVANEPSTPRYVVCNADESEPGTFKDRVILAELPHLVIEGILLAARSIGAERGWVYIRHEYEAEREALAHAIAQAHEAGVLGPSVCGSDFAFELEIFVSPGGYILGEETALLEAMEGKRGEPRNKPPFPGQKGLYGQPTLMNNVETLAHVPRIVAGADADLKFFSVSGDVATPGVHEVPVGTTAAELIERCGGIREGRELLAFLPGGASTGFLPAARADVVLDWEPLRQAGSALGSGAMVVVAKGSDLLDLAHNLTAFFRNESCGKCVPCRLGTAQAAKLIATREASGLALLEELHRTLKDTSLCGLGQVALVPVLSVLAHFPELAASESRPS